MAQLPNIKNERLIALWAFSESALGGVMHAFKLPFTGFILGAISLIIMSLIARAKANAWKPILEATLLVLLVKFMVSPQSPPGAYIALAFQGLCGAAFFSLLGINTVSAGITGFLVMVESSLQKIITTTLIFGENIWTAIDIFFTGILKELGFATDTAFSWWLIGFYVGIYALWGIVAGIYAAKFSATIEGKSKALLQKLNKLPFSAEKQTATGKRKRNKLAWVIAGLLFMVILFAWQQNNSLIVFVVLRTLAAVVVIYFIINPLLKWLMQRFFSKASSGRQQQIQQIIEELPSLRANIQPALSLAGQSSAGMAKAFHFIQNFIILSLYR